MARKIIILLIFILVGLATFLAGYLLSQRSAFEVTEQPALVDNSILSRFEKTPEKYGPPVGIYQITKEAADFVAFSADGKDIIYYVPRTGDLRSGSIQDPSARSNLIAKIQPGATKISWSSNKVLLASYENKIIYYDLNSGLSKRLDSKIKNPVFSKSGDKIAYDYFDENEKVGEIRIADWRMETSKKIMATLFGNWQIEWLNDTSLSLIKPPDSDASAYWLFTLDTENGWFERVLENKTDLEVLWSPNGQKLIYSDFDETNKTILFHLLDRAASRESEINLSTLASKCSWSIDNKTLYCATPSSFSVLDVSAENLVPKNIFDSSHENISRAAENAESLVLSSSEDYLMFKNSQDGRIYGFHLGQ